MHDELREALRDLKGTLRVNVPLADYSHLRIGGPAELFVEPFVETDVGLVVRSCRELGVALHVLGGGSNVLVGDAGVRGVVLFLGALNRVVRDGARLSAGAGVALAALMRNARELGLAGLECLAGIPAMVGGAVAMNAGTREGETFDRIESLTVVDGDGEIRELGADALDPRYRDGGLGERIVLQATFALEPDDPKAIRSRFESYLKYRNSTQPASERSVGCVFKNPPGDAAGRLIEVAGCKLWQRGDVQVSSRHANYFVNLGGGTCDDFLRLMADVRERVAQESGVELLPEVKIWR